MPRPYTDPVEIITEPVPAQSPFIPGDAKIVVGAVAPASPDPDPDCAAPRLRVPDARMAAPGHPRDPWATGAQTVRATRRQRRIAAPPNACLCRRARLPGLERARRRYLGAGQPRPAFLVARST